MQDLQPSSELTDAELVDLVQRVFAPRPDEHRLALLVDLPDAQTADHAEWADRRLLVADWWRRLQAAAATSGLDADLYAYRNVRANNADLPDDAWQVVTDLPSDVDAAADLEVHTFDDLFGRYPIFIAVTQFSATAPLKLMSRRHGFRAATMPGFNRQMVDALRLDYGEVDQMVRRLARRLDEASAATFEFLVNDRSYALTLDLRHRPAHPSGGLVRQPGQAGNLPSGEAYIVPYEGEIEGDPSASAGLLPVELDGEVVIYRIVENQAVEVLSEGPRSRQEAAYLKREPAYGNLAELGLGVLASFGVQPVGRILLDEKLGLHIAFGRSDHFGGQVGAAQFSSPEAVVHIDRVYLPATQPSIRVAAIDLVTDEGSVPLMRDGLYV